MPARPTRPAPEASVAMMRAAAVGAGLSVPGAALVGGVVRGSQAALHAAAGAILAVVLLTVGLATITVLVHGAGALVLPAALVLYLTIAFLLLVLAWRLDGVEGLQRVPFGLGAVGATGVFQVLTTAASLRARHPVYGSGTPR